MGQPDEIEYPNDAIKSWCLDCDYPLKGLTEKRCPECGREFNPRDTSTMRTPETPSRFAQWIMRPPGRRSFWLTIVGTAFTLACGAAPGGYLGFGFVILFWMLLLPAWGIRLFVWALACLLANNGRGLRIDRKSAQWLVIPGAFVLNMLLLFTWIPLRIGFLVSHSAMETLAADIITANVNPPSSKWVGIYRAENINKTNWGMYFTVSGTGPMQVGGFAYSPSGPPDFNAGEIAFHPIGGRWYAWYEDW